MSDFSKEGGIEMGESRIYGAKAAQRIINDKTPMLEATQIFLEEGKKAVFAIDEILKPFPPYLRKEILLRVQSMTMTLGFTDDE